MGLRVIGGLSLVIGSMALGYALKRLGWLTQPRATRLVRFIVVVTAPLVACLSVWHIELRRPEPWLLPLLGGLISASTLLPARWYAARAGFSRPQTGSFLTCSFFSNVGYFGALTAFALFGEHGYALCVLYFLFFTPCFYTLGFWLASHYGRRGPAPKGTAFNAALGVVPLLGVALGAALSLAGVPRPAPLGQFNHLFIPVDTGLYLLAIGSQLTLESPRPHWRPCTALSLIKFLYTPTVAWLLLAAFRLEGLPRLIVLIEASTPVAVSPLIFPLLFGLDRSLTNALWLFTTLVAVAWFILLIPALPLL